jgi:ubiquinone/menaquinone biosynthesis C-methylase UbiE
MSEHQSEKHMNTTMSEKPDYGNWVSTKLIYTFGAISLLFFVLSLLLPILVVVAGIALLIAAYFAYAHYEFSAGGENIQSKIQDRVVEHLDWDGQGKALDIGCGAGPLAIKLAHKFPSAQVTGVDSWGAMWQYSQSGCERNAEIEGVADQVTFQKGTAAALPFADGAFDAAVSNLAFHEVRDVADKREVLREALRVVKKGGRFAFQDLFEEPHMYGEMDDLIAALKRWGVTKVAFDKTNDATFIPKALKLPFMVGAIGVLYGEK